MGFMDIFEIVAFVLAGVGCFLIGFKLMSDNLEKLFGNGLKALFNKTSEQKLVNVGMGAAVTAVIQSSGVTTVMVVGFVNAGIMTLYQAASIIMGANIGTTITAQLAALSSLPIDVIFILLLGIGVFLEMFSKNEKVKRAGLVIAGLGMVFLGLDVMKTTMGPLADNPAIKQFLSNMTNPFVLLLFGVIFTTLMQSSSAVTTIIIGMAATGLVIGGVYNDAGELVSMTNAVLYIILGSNIGSTTTALLSSAGTTANARRASMIHLLFNTIGSIIFMVMLLLWPNFYEITFCAWFPEPSTQIAMFHTFFNVLCTLLFLPFTKLLVKMATALVPDKKEEKAKSALVYMDKRLLKTPAVAVGQLVKETIRMADLAMESVETSFNAFIERDISAVEVVAAKNEIVMAIGSEISDFLVQVSAAGVGMSDEILVNALHSNVGDVARIAEIADNFMKYTAREVKENLVFSEGISEKLVAMHGLLKSQYEAVKTMILERNIGMLSTADELEDQTDAMRKQLVDEHILRLAQGKCRPENNTVFINLVSNLERIGDHINFIAHSATGTGVMGEIKS